MAPKTLILDLEAEEEEILSQDSGGFLARSSWKSQGRVETKMDRTVPPPIYLLPRGL